MVKAMNLIYEINNMLTRAESDISVWFSAGKQVSFATLYGLKLRSDIQLAPGVIATFTQKSATHLTFLIKFLPNANLQQHCHDCIETCYVVAGKIYDTSTKQFYVQTDFFTVPANKVHNLRANSEGCTLLVHFSRL